MIGKSWIREQGLQDPLMVEALRKLGMQDVPLWEASYPGKEQMAKEKDDAIRHWNDMLPHRDGPVNPNRVEVTTCPSSTSTRWIMPGTDCETMAKFPG